MNEIDVLIENLEEAAVWYFECHDSGWRPTDDALAALNDAREAIRARAQGDAEGEISRHTKWLLDQGWTITKQAKAETPRQSQSETPPHWFHAPSSWWSP